jgi:hypothetical protein
MTLPALPGPATDSHAGRWTAHVELASAEELKKWLSSLDGQLENWRSVIGRGSLPYEIVSHARSNLAFSASVRQGSLQPGTRLELSARLCEYGVPYLGSADVRAEVTRPDGLRVDVSLDRYEPGGYAASVAAAQAGLYRIRTRAVGATSAGHTFTREKSMTASIFAGGDRPRVDPRPDGDTGSGRGGDREFYCRLLNCLLGDEGVRRWLKRHKLDADTLRKCLEDACKTELEMATGVVAHPVANDADLARMVTVARRELLRTSPEQVLPGAVKAVAPHVREPASERLAPKDRREPFGMSPEAAELMKKKKTTTKRKTQKKR